MSYFSRWYIQPSIVKIVDAQANDIYDTRIAATSFNGYTFRDIEFIKQSTTISDTDLGFPTYKDLASRFEGLSSEIYHCNVKFPLQKIKELWNVEEIDSQTYGDAIVEDINQNGGKFRTIFIDKIIEDFVEFEKAKINKVGRFLEGDESLKLYLDEEEVKLEPGAGHVLRALIRNQCDVYLSGRYYIETGDKDAGSLINFQAVLFLSEKLVESSELIAPPNTYIPWGGGPDAPLENVGEGIKTLGLQLLREIACEPVPKPKKKTKADDPKAETKKKKLTPRDKEARKLTAREKEEISKAVKAKLLQVSDSAFLNAILNADKIKTRKDAFDFVLNVTPLSAMLDIAVDCLQKTIPTAPDVLVCDIIMKGLSDGDVKKILRYANTNITTDGVAAAFKSELIDAFNGSVDDDPVGFKNFLLTQFNANVGTKQIMCAMVFAALPAAITLLALFLKQNTSNLTPMGTCGDPLSPPELKLKKKLESPVKNVLLQIEKGLKSHPIVSFTKNLPDNLLRQLILYVDKIIVKAISKMLQELAYLCDGSSKSDFANAAAQTSPYNRDINDLLVNKNDDAVYDDLFNFLFESGADIDKNLIKDLFDDISDLLTISELCVLMTAEPTDIRYNLIIDKIFYGLLELDRYAPIKSVLNTRAKLINFINVFAANFDEVACNDRIEELTRNKKIFSDLCSSTDNAYINDLKDKVAQSAIDDMLNQDNDILDDLLNALKDLAAPETPEPFCGPAATESGVTPLLPSFQDESQLYLARKNLESLLDIAIKAFESEVNNFKTVLGKNDLVQELPGVVSAVSKTLDSGPQVLGAMSKIYGLEETVENMPPATNSSDIEKIKSALKGLTAKNKLVAPKVYSILTGIGTGANLDVSYLDPGGTFNGQILKLSTEWEDGLLAYYAYYESLLASDSIIDNPVDYFASQGLTFEETGLLKYFYITLKNTLQQSIQEVIKVLKIRSEEKVNQLEQELQEKINSGNLSEEQINTLKEITSANITTEEATLQSRISLLQSFATLSDQEIQDGIEQTNLEANPDYTISEFNLDGDDAMLSPGTTKLVFYSGEEIPSLVYNGVLSNNSVINPLQNSGIFNSLSGANIEKDSPYKQVVKDFVENEPLFFGEILERIIVEHAEFISTSDLFKRELFNGIDLIKKNPCDPSLMYLSDISSKMEKRIKDIECLVGIGSIPTPSEIVHTASLYEATVRVVVLNEMMKMFFVFTSFGLEVLLPLSGDDQDTSFYYDYLFVKVQNRMNELVPDQFAESIEKAIRFTAASDLGIDADQLSSSQPLEIFIKTSIKFLQLRIANILNEAGVKTKIPDPQVNPEDIINGNDTDLYSGQFLKDVYLNPEFGGTEYLYEQMVKNIIPAEKQYSLLSPPPVRRVDFNKMETIIPSGFYSNNPRMRNGGFFIEEGFEIFNQRFLDDSQHTSDNFFSADGLQSLLNLLVDTDYVDPNSFIYQGNVLTDTSAWTGPLRSDKEGKSEVFYPGNSISWEKMVEYAKKNLYSVFGYVKNNDSKSDGYAGLDFINRYLDGSPKYFPESMPFNDIPEFPDFEDVEKIRIIDGKPTPYTETVPIPISKDEIDINIKAQYNYFYFTQKYLFGGESTLAEFDTVFDYLGVDTTLTAELTKIRSTFFNDFFPGQTWRDKGPKEYIKILSNTLKSFSSRQGRIPLSNSNVVNEMKYIFEAIRWFSEEIEKSIDKQQTLISDGTFVQNNISESIAAILDPIGISYDDDDEGLIIIKDKIKKFESYFYKFGKYRTFNMLVRIHDESDVEFIFNSLKESLINQAILTPNLYTEGGTPSHVVSNMQSFMRSVFERKYFLREESNGLKGGNLYFKLPLLYKYEPVASLEEFENKIIQGTQELEINPETIVDSFNTLFKSIPYKDLLSFVSIMVTETLSSEYPALDDVFKNTILTLGTGTKQALEMSDRLNNPDTYKSQIDSDAYGGTRVASPDMLSDFIAGLLKGIANMTDPTWRTEWFLPGPLTPFGMIAKILEGEEDSESTEDAIEKTKEDNAKGAEKSVDCEKPPNGTGEGNNNS